MRIYLSNQSTVVSNTQVQQIIAAMNVLLTSLYTDWGLSPIQMFQSFTRVSDPLQNYTIFIFDNTDSPGALGYHFDTSGLAIGKVFAKTILNYGGVVLYRDANTMTVAQCICHEAMEMVGNPNVNKWILDNSGTFWAAELCDAVQNNIYVVTVSGVKVGLSDYLLPSWFVPNTRVGPFNKMNTLRAPLTIDRYGYSILIRNNRVGQIYGISYPDSKKREVEEDVNEIKEKFGLQ
jgi:hypothetical protein